MKIQKALQPSLRNLKGSDDHELSHFVVARQRILEPAAGGTAKQKITLQQGIARQGSTLRGYRLPDGGSGGPVFNSEGQVIGINSAYIDGFSGGTLGGAAMGVSNLLCLTGDGVQAGDHPQATPVFDLDSMSLLQTARTLRRAKLIRLTLLCLLGTVAMLVVSVTR